MSAKPPTLRDPFPESEIGKLPRITCQACSRSQGRVCDEHNKIRCQTCSNWITTAHMHLDYVGHAETTDRLLAVDPQWTWEPLGVDERGLPAFDGLNGLWIRLTVNGVTRLGYGHAGDKRGGDAIKEAIGDAIRNAAMRFGVALDLWRKTERADAEHPDHAAEDAARQPEHLDASKLTRTKPNGDIAVDEWTTTPPVESAEDDPLKELKRKVWAAAKMVGLDNGPAVEANYAQYTQGMLLSDAKDFELQAYLAHLEAEAKKAGALDGEQLALAREAAEA